MKLTPKLAEQIAARYEAKDWSGKTPVDRALLEVLCRQGGLFAVLNDDARRDLILTLGDNHRNSNATAARQRAIRAAE